MWRSALSIALVIVLQVYLLGPELYKLPVLFAHYLEHAATDESFDMDSFVHLHYVDHGHGENGDTDHERLPFHHHHTSGPDCCGPVMHVAQSVRAEGSPCAAQARPLALPNVGGPMPGYTDGLLQPPRLVA